MNLHIAFTKFIILLSNIKSNHRIVDKAFLMLAQLPDVAVVMIYVEQV